jgi:2-polyprenyl-6-methoxyphenol hydroxylase-like FAD-dependent oxidoreductase
MDRPALFDPYGPFWHLDRRQFDLMLLNHAKHRGVKVLLGTRLVCSDWCGTQWQARLRSANHEFTLRARFLVDATGRAGFLAGRLSRRTDRIDRLIGISKRFSGQDCRREPWTLVEAIGDGWWYSSPLPSGETLAVFMTDADLIQGLHDQDGAWNSWLVKSEYTQKRLRGLENGSKWKVQSAQSCFNHSNSEDHWLAVGDAAIACDPLAGRGLTMSLETGIAAAYVIAEFRNGRTDPADRYRRALIESWEVYCRQLTETYSLERRWPNSPFWLRRHCKDYTDRSPAVLANARDSSVN